MPQVKVRLLRPLDGVTEKEPLYERADAERLQAYGAVKIIGPAEKAAPTVNNKMEAVPANKVDGSAFDHDGDGKPGGSRPRAARKG